MGAGVSVHPHMLTHIEHTYSNRCSQALTDGAVLAVPSLVALALSILAGSVFDAEGVADTLIAARAGPALFAAARPAHAHAMGPTVDGAHL